MIRSDGRTQHQMRPVRLTPKYTKNAHGSCLVEYGNTMVLCTCSVEKFLPPFLKNSNPPQGWVTAEYSMLPGSSSQRVKRERPAASGRSQEIQRLIGRSIRGVIDPFLIPELTLNVDCDVLQADGGTRTASITGGYVALALAVRRLMKERVISRNPLIDAVAALSVGIKQGELLVDLDYSEDSTADLDMNVVMTASGKILELQGTAERAAFTKDQVISIIDVASSTLSAMYENIERAISDESIVEF